jgi:hypothetical protein
MYSESLLYENYDAIKRILYALYFEDKLATRFF